MGKKQAQEAEFIVVSLDDLYKRKYQILASNNLLPFRFTGIFISGNHLTSSND